MYVADDMPYASVPYKIIILAIRHLISRYLDYIKLIYTEWWKEKKTLP